MLTKSIFTNTGGEIVTSKDEKIEILGTPTKAALLDFGLFLGGDFQAEQQASKLVKVEPFNSVKKRMGVVLLGLLGGGFQAHCKGIVKSFNHLELGHGRGPSSSSDRRNGYGGSGGGDGGGGGGGD